MEHYKPQNLIPSEKEIVHRYQLLFHLYPEIRNQAITFWQEIANPPPNANPSLWVDSQLTHHALLIATMLINNPYFIIGAHQTGTDLETAAIKESLMIIDTAPAVPTY